MMYVAPFVYSWFFHAIERCFWLLLVVLGCSELFQLVPTCFSVCYVVSVLGCFGCSSCFWMLLVVVVCCSVLHFASIF